MSLALTIQESPFLGQPPCPCIGTVFRIWPLGASERPHFLSSWLISCQDFYPGFRGPGSESALAHCYKACPHWHVSQSWLLMTEEVFFIFFSLLWHSCSPWFHLLHTPVPVWHPTGSFPHLAEVSLFHTQTSSKHVTCLITDKIYDKRTTVQSITLSLEVKKQLLKEGGSWRVIFYVDEPLLWDVEYSSNSSQYF